MAVDLEEEFLIVAKECGEVASCREELDFNVQTLANRRNLPQVGPFASV